MGRFGAQFSPGSREYVDIGPPGPRIISIRRVKLSMPQFSPQSSMCLAVQSQFMRVCAKWTTRPVISISRVNLCRAALFQASRENVRIGPPGKRIISISRVEIYMQQSLIVIFAYWTIRGRASSASPELRFTCSKFWQSYLRIGPPGAAHH